MSVNFYQTSARCRQNPRARNRRDKQTEEIAFSLFSYSFFFSLMLACGSLAFLHLWQYAARCRIGPELRGGQIAILPRDEVSSKLIIFRQSFWRKKKEEEEESRTISLYELSPAAGAGKIRRRIRPTGGEGSLREALCEIFRNFGSSYGAGHV